MSEAAQHRALLVVDVQNDFCEGGALGVDGGNRVAERVAALLAQNADYALLVASQDWHEPDSDNGGHFARGSAPDFKATWPEHCVQGTAGAELHPALQDKNFDIRIKKGMGEPAYSAFEGVDQHGRKLVEVLREAGVTELDVVGIATDYCVLQSAWDALNNGFTVRVLENYIAGVAPETSLRALERLAEAGAEIDDA